ncbi:MAG: PD-(D/E)XK nuclease family protein, partial [Eubacterium sp.]|nr:PD-(D/E)XK nuclease family protein [Eubacterium sp.]
DRGNIFHNALETLYHKMTDEGLTWRTVREDQLQSLGEASFDEESGSRYREDVFGQDHRSAYMLRRMKRVFLKTISYMHDQMLVGDFDQIAAEATFDSEPHDPGTFTSPLTTIKLAGKKQINLRGRIDRIDACEINGTRYIKILDYKSSRKDLDLNKVYYGLELQLFTYLAIAESYPGGPGESKPAALLFQPIDEKQQKWKPQFEDPDVLDKETIKAVRPEGYFAEDMYLHLDENLGEESYESVAIHANTTKDGWLGTRAKDMSRDDMEEVIKYTRAWIKDAAKTMYRGDIHARSYLYKQENGCTYCPYAGVCGIEPRTREDMTRELTSREDWDVINAMAVGEEDGFKSEEE